MKATEKDGLARKVTCDHDCLLENLRSLDHTLENIFYYGEVCSDLRGFGSLRQRCEELRQVLLKHIPEGEQMFAEVPEGRKACKLLPELVEDHRVMLRALEQSLKSLEALQNGQIIPEDLFSLQEQVRNFSARLQTHIRVVNQQVLPEIEAT